MTIEAQPVSPQIVALREAVGLGDRTALQAFWQRAESECGPIVEAMEGDHDNVLVTFTWRERGGLSNVCLDSPAFRQAGIARWLDNQLAHMPGTDLFFRTYCLPTKLRASYLFALDAPLITAGDPPDEAMQRFYAFLADRRSLQPDPLNPKTMAEHLGRDADRVWSVLELPDAPRHPWAARREDIEHSVEHVKTFRSTVLGNEREISVWTPPRYSESDEPYGLVLGFDAPLFVPTTLDNLLADGLIEPMVAALVTNPNLETRNRELTCNEAFPDFLATELLPWLRTTYKITADPERTVLTGCSAGGLAASFAALRHPELFGNVLSQSGAYWWGPGHVSNPGVRQTNVQWEWLPKQFEATPKLPICLYLNVGLSEVGEVDMLRSNRLMRDVLLAKDYNVTYEEFFGGHDLACWQGFFANGLLALVSRPEA